MTQSSVGKVNAIICTQTLIGLYKPEILLSTVVAGGSLRNIQAGDVIVASHVVHYDMDLAAFGHLHGKTPGRDRLIECDPDLVAEATQAFGSAFDSQKGGPNLMLGTIVSGDRSIQNIDMLLWLQR